MHSNQSLSQYKGRHDPTIKTKRQTHTQHALSNTTSLRKAVNAKCWDCCGGGLTFKESGGVRKEIAQCTTTDCSLHHFRPYKNEKALKVSTLASALDSSSRNNGVN